MARSLFDPALAAAHEKRTGLPAGTLAAIVERETGNQQRFLDKPDDFHYSVGPNGEKPKSTARGLGGVLEGTARDPGYGVAPLKDWTVPEQMRFIADYTAARTKQAGSLEGGLSAYGEGAGYGKAVAARIGKGAPVNSPVVTPVNMEPVQSVQLAQAPQQAAPEQVAQSLTPEPIQVAPPMQVDPSWGDFQQAMPRQVQMADLDYGKYMPQAQANVAPNFTPFGRFKGRV